MTEQLPAPLVPADVDLRGLEYMPLFGNHLFGSEFNAAASDAEWRAALTLWWAAWNQVPAGSLPPDDTALCRLADLGRDLKAWRKVKARALHGFEPCSDSRLYHRFVCAQALIAWDKRVKERERKAKWRASRDAERDGDRIPPQTGQGRGRDADVPADGKRRDVTGRDGTISLLPPDGGSGLAPSGAAPPTPPPAFTGLNAEGLNGKAVVPIDRAFELPTEWGFDAEALGFKPSEVEQQAERFRQYWTAGKGHGTRRSVKGWRQSWSNWLAKAAQEGRR